MKIQMLAGVVMLAGCASADQILLDNRPALGFGIGYTVGTDQGFEVVQPFTVTDAAGWNLKRIWLDGFKVAGSGQMKIDVRETDNGPSLASAIVVMNNTDAQSSQYVSGDLDINLTGGASYVIRVMTDNPNGWNALYYSSVGSTTRSYNNSNQSFDNLYSLATYFEGNLAPSPAGLSLLGLSGLVATRRRR